MSYATQAQLVERYGARMLIQLTDRATPPAGEIDAGVVARALADTDAMIDGYLAGRYRLPLAETPALVVDLAIAVSVYKLHRTAATEKIRQDYEDALRMLREIAAGQVRLNVEGVEPPSSGAAGVRATDRERELTPESMRGFI